MGTLSDLLAADAGPEPKLCAVQRWINTLDDADRLNLLGLLGNPAWNTSRIWRFVHEGAGFAENRSTFALHFNNGCCCG